MAEVHDDGEDSEQVSGKKPFGWWIFFVILLLLIGGGVYSYQKGLLGGNRQTEEPQNEILSPDSGHAPRRGGKKTKPGSGKQLQTNPNDSGAVLPEDTQQPTETATASQTTDSSQNSVQQTVEAVSATASSGDADVVSSDEQAVQEIMQNKQN